MLRNKISVFIVSILLLVFCKFLRNCCGLRFSEHKMNMTKVIRLHACASCKECFNEKPCNECTLFKYVESTKNWTSANSVLDNIIKNPKSKIIEWIPYEQLSYVIYLTKGGFGEISRAKWIDGPIKWWSHKENKFQREHGEEVILKLFPNSRNICQSFLHEVPIFSSMCLNCIKFLLESSKQRNHFCQHSLTRT